jgi:N-acetylneuraminic acid mutarotase
MVQPHQAATATLLPNGKVLVVGSFPASSTAAELYDPASDGWSLTGPMIVARAVGTATLLPSGKVLVAGGIAADTGHSTTRAEIYDPATNAWSAADGMAVQRSGHAAALLQSGKVLVAGGQNASGYIATTELYDPVSDRWTMAARMDAGYAGPYATLLANGMVLFAGGSTFGDGRGELYNPATDRWSNAGTAARNTQTATRLADGRVLTTGQGKEAHLYDPATNHWSVAASMLQDRDIPTATRLTDGRVLVSGGSTTTGGQQLWLTSAEVYDPALNRWSPAGCMGQARWEHTSTLLPTKKVLIAGGDVPSVALSSAELFDPSPGWTSQPVESCPTNQPIQAGAATPSPAASTTEVGPSAVPTASARAAVQPVPLTAIRVGSLTVSRLTAIGIAGALALLLLAAAIYAWARWRRRGI